MSEVDQFKRGWLIACTSLHGMHDEPSMAGEVLAVAEINQIEVNAMDLAEYDQARLAEIRKACHIDPILKDAA